jgi:hypothetical protein
MSMIETSFTLNECLRQKARRLRVAIEFYNSTSYARLTKLETYQRRDEDWFKIFLVTITLLKPFRIFTWSLNVT